MKPQNFIFNSVLIQVLNEINQYILNFNEKFDEFFLKNNNNKIEI